MSDLISRQAAIDAIAHATFDVTIGGRRGFIDYKKAFEKAFVAIRDKYIEALEALPSAQPEITRCKDCGHFHYDTPYVIQGVPVLGHEVCDFWGDGCKTSENGYCSLAVCLQKKELVLWDLLKQLRIYGNKAC